ncbi:hypothetical protein [Marinobacter sp.]|uniref:hypothetical protein n=1 Tax=Marinobacter sp. TaxID=50741 RepID=UPI003A8EC34C
MNQLIEADQKQIFEGTLGNTELEAVKSLASKHKANSAFTQQLALDASRLVTSSRERLSKQSEAGFFKRFASVISGKTREQQLLNQSDILQVQKLAWHYLQQLQEQSLITAQSIAVIRNNLGTMNEYIIETRDFLEQAVDKIDQRLQHVENNTNLNSWALNIESNKRRLKSTPKTFLALRLTYDFINSHQDLLLTEREINNYLITTLERLGINCDEEIKLLDFIIELIDQLELTGIDQYRKIIELSFDEHTLTSDYIQKNISGTGFNALYFLSENYEKIYDLTSDSELCNSDDAREKIISKFFGNEYSSLTVNYDTRNLIFEVISGSQLAIDIYKEEHGLNAVESEINEEVQPEIITLISSLPTIEKHTLLDSEDTKDFSQTYLSLLALCFESSNSVNNLVCEFVAQLAEKTGTPEPLNEFKKLADNSNIDNYYRDVLLNLLDDDNKKYTWLIDTFFLSSIAYGKIERAEIKVLLGILKPAQLENLLPHMLQITNGNDPDQILKSIIKLYPYTDSWKNIIHYRQINFDQYFSEALDQLLIVNARTARLNIEASNVSNKGYEYSYFFRPPDEGFLSKLGNKATEGAFFLGRRTAVSSLNELCDKVTKHISENYFALAEANSLISPWDIPCCEFVDIALPNDFELDNSGENEEWGDQFANYYRQIQNKLDDFDDACNLAFDQLVLFSKGNFDQSVIKIREQARAESQKQKQQKGLKKQSAVFIKEGKEHFLHIDWQKIENPPCSPEQIRRIKTDGKVWLLFADIESDEVLYQSENGLNWKKIKIDEAKYQVVIKNIMVENGIWILTNKALHKNTREEGYYYSHDAVSWKYNSAPESSNNAQLSLNEGRLSYGRIFHFNGFWLWEINQLKSYSYVEKGMFSKSNKTDSYKNTIYFCAETLDGPWERWDNTPEFPEGVTIQATHSLPRKNALLAFCEVDESYRRNKKKPEKPPFVMYYGSRGRWQECTWPETNTYINHSQLIFFTESNGAVACINPNELFSSENGYSWSQKEIALSADEYFPLKDFGLLTNNENSTLYVSQDTNQFNELRLDEGKWQHLTANNEAILGVYCVNNYEEVELRIGRYTYFENS